MPQKSSREGTRGRDREFADLIVRSVSGGGRNMSGATITMEVVFVRHETAICPVNVLVHDSQ